MIKKANKLNQPATEGKIFLGKVVSDKMTGTVVVSLEYKSRHPIYRKIIKKHKNIYVDNNLKVKTGDFVKVKECRPLSKLKRFTTVEVIKVS